jgi:hypothetical protein
VGWRGIMDPCAACSQQPNENVEPATPP